MAKTKVVFVMLGFAIGGIEVSLINLLNRIDYNKYDVTCVLVTDRKELLDRVNKNCKIYYISRSHSDLGGNYRYRDLYQFITDMPNVSIVLKVFRRVFGKTLKSIENRGFLNYVKSELGKRTYDVAVAYTMTVCEVVKESISAQKRYAFYHFGEITHIYHEEVGYYAMDKIAVVSKGMESKFQKEYPRLAERTVVIPNLVDTDLVKQKAAVSDLELRQGCRWVFVSVGRLVKDKGFDIAIDAAGILKEKKIDFKWYIVGGGVEEQNLKKKITELGLENYVYMTGWKENPYPYIKQCDLYIQSSRIESFGITIREAQILGKPVVSTDTDGARANIIEGKNGFICNTNSDGIAWAIANCVNQQDFYHQIVLSTKRIDYEVFNIDTYNKVEELLDSQQKRGQLNDNRI